MTGPGFSLIEPQPHAPFVVLASTTSTGETAPAGTVAKTQCIPCSRWLWLDGPAHALITAGKARPICLPCITEIHAQDPTAVEPAGQVPGYEWQLPQ